MMKARNSITQSDADENGLVKPMKKTPKQLNRAQQQRDAKMLRRSPQSSGPASNIPHTPQSRRGPSESGSAAGDSTPLNHDKANNTTFPAMFQNIEMSRTLMSQLPAGTTVEDILSMHSRLETQLKTIDHLRQENGVLSSSLLQAEAQLGAAREQLEGLESTNANLQRQVSRGLTEKEDQRAQITVLERQLHTAGKSVEELTETTRRQQGEIHSLEEQLGSSRKETAAAVDARLQATKHHHEEVRMLTEEYTKRIEEEHAKAQSLEATSNAQMQRLTEVEADLSELRVAADRLKQSESQMGAKQLETLTLVRDALESKLQKEIDQRESAIVELKQLLQETRRESFHHLACAIKLSLCMAGQRCNLEIQPLWERLQAEEVPPAEWNGWISLKFAEAARESERIQREEEEAIRQQQFKRRASTVLSSKASTAMSINQTSTKRSRFA